LKTSKSPKIRKRKKRARHPSVKPARDQQKLPPVHPKKREKKANSKKIYIQGGRGKKDTNASSPQKPARGFSSIKGKNRKSGGVPNHPFKKIIKAATKLSYGHTGQYPGPKKCAPARNSKKKSTT